MANTGKTGWDKFVDKVYTQPTPQQQKALNSLVNALPGSMTPVGGDQQSQLEAMARALGSQSGQPAQAQQPPQMSNMPWGAGQQPQFTNMPQAPNPQPSFIDLLAHHLAQMLMLPKPQSMNAQIPNPQGVQGQPMGANIPNSYGVPAVALPQRMQAGPALQQYSNDLSSVLQELQRQNTRHR